jgi:RNA polymerase sigma factor (sigma-70 family)
MIREKQYAPLTEEEQRLVEQHMRLVYMVVGRVVRANHDDYAQDGVFALVDAIRNYDPSKGFKFSTYAATCIRMSLFRKLSTDYLVRPPEYLVYRERKAGRPLAKAMHGPIEDRAYVSEEIDDSESMLKDLTDMHREAIRATVIDGMSHAEAGRKFGCGKTCIGQRVHQGIKKLRKAYGVETTKDHR